jgi:hypothetical protein
MVLLKNLECIKSYEYEEIRTRFFGFELYAFRLVGQG